ncbi:hypothetical protein DXT63_02190 [Thermoanaerobacteraceae bacterium SP2]|nr:hypothetical protein DXT63_02190 [Thermoanaerobacteraceae bacterium SP2]
MLGPYRTGMGLSPKKSQFFGGALLQFREREEVFAFRPLDNRQISWLSFFFFTTGKYLRLFFYFKMLRKAKIFLNIGLSVAHFKKATSV